VCFGYIFVNTEYIQDQINSTIRVWNKYGNSFQKTANQKFIAEYITKWKKFSVIIDTEEFMPVLGCPNCNRESIRGLKSAPRALSPCGLILILF